MAWTRIAGSPYAKTTVTVADAATTSGALDMEEYTLVRISYPAGLEGTTTTFLTSDSESGTYQDVYVDDNNQYSLTVAASREVGLDPAEAVWLGPWIKVKLATQTGAYTLTLYGLNMFSASKGY